MGKNSDNQWASDDKADDLLGDVLEDVEQEAEEEKRQIQEKLQKKKQQKKQKQEEKKKQKRQEAQKKLSAEQKRLQELEQKKEAPSREEPTQPTPQTQKTNEAPNQAQKQKRSKSRSEDKSTNTILWVAVGGIVALAGGFGAFAYTSDSLFYSPNTQTYSKSQLQPLSRGTKVAQLEIISVNPNTVKKRNRPEKTPERPQKGASTDNPKAAQPSKNEKNKPKEKKDDKPVINIGEIDSDPLSSDNF